MKGSRHLYAILGLVVILTAVSFSSGGFKTVAKAPTQSVLVVNTNATAVPTTVTSLPAVQIGNDRSNPVPVTVAATTHVPAGVAQSALIPDGESTVNALVYVVPAGKNLIITGLFGNASLQPGQRIVLARLGNFPLIFQDTGTTGNRDISVASMQVNYIVPSGITLNLSVTASGIGPEGVVIGFNGYLEDAP